MRSWLPVLALAALLSVIVEAGLAAGATSRPRVALVVSGTVGPFVEATNALRAALERAAQPEILLFDLEGSNDKGGAVRQLIADAQPSLIVTVGTLATAVVLADPPRVPVVFCMVLYPEQSGFLPAHGRALTGATLDVPLDQQFATARRLLPAARRVGVVYSPAETGRVVDAARSAAKKHGFELITEAVDEPGGTPGAAQTLVDKVDLLWMVADSRVLNPQTTSALLLAAVRRGVPVFGLSAAHVRAGALAALTPDYADVGTQAGELALRVLGGDPVDKVPPTTPRKLSLALNLRTARHLELTVDAALEREASEIIR
jgi:putative ABC transport system substrate-binding protein